MPSTRDMAIDSSARRHAAELLGRFASGALTNDELERHWPATGDRAVEAVRGAVWHLFDDLRAHRYEPSAEADDLLARCRDFLATDAEYRWPRPSRWKLIATLPLSLVTFGLANRLLWRKHQLPAWWPFSSAEERESARNARP